MSKKLFVIRLLFLILLVKSCTTANKSDMNWKLDYETFTFDSVTQVRIIRRGSEIVYVEELKDGAITRVNAKDTLNLREYYMKSRKPGFQLFCYDCSACHSVLIEQWDSMNKSTYKDVNSLRGTLCSPKHLAQSRSLCNELNDFEIYLIMRYINGYKDLYYRP
jgi:hypothetical protein